MRAFERDGAVTIELTNEEAIVLYEWLVRSDDEGTRKYDHPAEEVALWRLEGSLEKSLSVQFLDYKEAVARAREEVAKNEAG